MKALVPKHLAYADLRGDRQYVSTGDLASNPRVAMIFMDYANQRRAKVYATATVMPVAEAGEIASRLAQEDLSSPIERIVVFTVAAFDWNCPQRVTPRYTVDEVQQIIDARQL